MKPVSLIIGQTPALTKKIRKWNGHWSDPHIRIAIPRPTVNDGETITIDSPREQRPLEPVNEHIVSVSSATRYSYRQTESQNSWR